jgi:spore coat polysaccharide biosynthesis protein SpsF
MGKDFKGDSRVEAFWRGEDGDAWQERCRLDDKTLASRIAMYTSVLRKTRGISSVFEFGPAAGHSLLAVKTLLPHVSCAAMEINEMAAKLLKENMPSCDVILGSIIQDTPPGTYDLVYTSGLLVCISEEYLPFVYENIYSSSNRFIALMEYYNPTPVQINYRGRTDITSKRDFAGEMLDKYPDLSLADYGFVYHRDSNFPADDINWFLLEKKG